MESTLALQLVDFAAEVGLFLGYGRGSVYPYTDQAWSTQQAAAIDSCVRSGVRQFYHPPEVMEGQGSYDWSFLKPTTTLTLPIATVTLALPDDFGGVEGPLTVLTTNSTSQPWRIDWKSEGGIRELYSATPQMSGPPMYVAQMPLKGTGPTQGQRFQLFFFPIPDQAYTVQFQYYINPDYLSGAFPYAYGGAQHAETILESCLAIAEQRFDDMEGVHAAKFLERLQASVSIDRRNKPQKLGYNADRSDRQMLDRSNVHYWAPAASYNGGSFN